MKKATIANINWGRIGCFACCICGACPGITFGTALSGASIMG